MKYLFALLLTIAGAWGASPSYSNFNTNDFTTNTVIGGQISIRISTNRFLTASNGNTVISNVFVSSDTFISNSAFVYGDLFVTNEFVVYGHALSNLLYWGTNATRGTITNRAPIDVSGDARFIGNITNEVLTPGQTVMTDANKALKSGFPPEGQIPNTGWEVFYEPWSGGCLQAVGGAAGRMGWKGQSSGVGQTTQTFTNDANHWGTIAIYTSTSANSIFTFFNSTALNNKPTIPALNGFTGWTNRFIWRMNGTNAGKAYIGLQSGDLVLNSPLSHGIGILLITTNNNQIMGFTCAGGSQSTTNLGGIIEGQWYTTQIWSTAAGVISYKLNDGAVATLSANVPSVALTPGFGLAKFTTATLTNQLELDEYVLIHAR